MRTVTGAILQAIRVEETPEEKRKKIESIVDSIKKDKGVWDYFWDEFKSLEDYVQNLIRKNVPELFPEN